MQSSSVENINFFGVVVIFFKPLPMTSLTSLWWPEFALLKTFWKYEVLKKLIFLEVGSTILLKPEKKGKK